MILPTKGVLPQQALIALGADILRLLSEAKTVSQLWHEFKTIDERGSRATFDWFVLSLDLLYMIGAIELRGERVRRARKDAPQ